jgi:osmotically inducible protein OsmC
VPRIVRKAEVAWEGSVARGRGTVVASSSGAFTLPVTLASRIGEPEGMTSPEELLAAAHGGCLTMSLAGELTGAGTPPGHLSTSVTIVMDEVEDQGHQIVGSVVLIVAQVDGIDDATLQAAVARADEGCPFSALLRRAGATIEVAAKLA